MIVVLRCTHSSIQLIVSSSRLKESPALLTRCLTGLSSSPIQTCRHCFCVFPFGLCKPSHRCGCRCQLVSTRQHSSARQLGSSAARQLSSSQLASSPARQVSSHQLASSSARQLVVVVVIIIGRHQRSSCAPPTVAPTNTPPEIKFSKKRAPLQQRVQYCEWSSS